MKTTLFCFSSTGNSLRIARDLAAEIGDTEITCIPQTDPTGARSEADRVGIVFPVYIFGMPNLVAEFCRKLTVKPNAYVFGVITYGGMPGAALPQLAKILSSRGISLSAGFGIAMPGNYTPLYGAVSSERQHHLFVLASERVRDIAAAVRSGHTGKLPSSPFLFNLFFHRFLYQVSMPRLGKSDEKFRVTETCDGCGICEKVCPVQNIKIQAGHPSWKHHCEQCMACLQWCPKEAIEFGKSTVGRRRYHHPDFTARDFMWRNLQGKNP
jgi:NAD-dependent dihydropyrimidine dehydrogenase PreA subunit